MASVYLNFDNLVVAQSAASKAWLTTSYAGQTLAAVSGPTQLGDTWGGGTLVGGLGDDSFYISDSNEKLVVTPGAGVDTVYTWQSYVLPDNVNNMYVEWKGMTGTANNGGDLLVALSNDITLVGGTGNDVLVDAGNGGNFFKIGASSGHDVIYGFQASGANHDFIQLTSGGFTNFADVKSHLSQVGSDTLLTLSANDAILIRDTQVSQLSAADFALNIDLSHATTTFDEEFNNLSLYDPTTGSGVWKTNFRSGGQSGVDDYTSRTLPQGAEQQIYVDPSYAGSGSASLGLNPFSVSNGVMTITASNTPTEDLSALHGYKYTSGLLTTEKSFTQLYGYFEVKAELPSGKGVWPGFWLLPANGGWPPELDVIEQIGGPTIYQTVHSLDANGNPVSTAYTSYVPTNTTGFHTYGVLWTKATLNWYIDGVEVASTATPAEMNQPIYMLVNLAMGGNFPGSPPTDFTSAQMQVDYIRAYSLASLGMTSSDGPAAPTSLSDAYSVMTTGTLKVDAAHGVLANDADNNAQVMKASLAANGAPAHGALTLNADGSFTYKPTLGFAGTDSFTYVASDSLSTGAPTTVKLTVGAFPIVTHSVSYTGKENTGLSVDAAHGVLVNDIDGNGLPMSAQLAANGGPAHGTLALNANGSFVYTPTAGYYGADSFTYIASDGLVSAQPMTVNLKVNPLLPVAHSDYYNVKAGNPMTVAAASGVLANDTDPNNLALSVTLASNPGHGTVSLKADGSFVYTPVAGFVGSDTFTYLANDCLGAGAVTTVTLKVAATMPVGAPNSYALTRGSSLTTDAAHGVLADDIDPNGLALKATLATGPAHGSLALNADGSFTYTPVAGYVGTDSFKYTPSDSLISGYSGTVTLNVTAPVTTGGSASTVLVARGGGTASLPVPVITLPDPTPPPPTPPVVTYVKPTTATDSYDATSGTPVSADAAHGVLANDVDNNGLTLSATLAANGGPAHGALSLNADGSFVYTAKPDYAGPDTFTYVASDGVTSSAPVTVTLNVQTPPIVGGPGNDTYWVTNSAVKIIEQAGGGNDTIETTVSYVVPDNVENVHIHGSGLTLIGKAAGGNWITSLDGGNTLIGGAGGNDVFTISHPNDVIVVTPGTVNETVRAWSSYSLSDNIQNLVGQGARQITLVGNGMDNTIVANANSDILTGGGGADTFVVAPGPKLQTITDFTPGDGDQIDITAFLARNLSPTFHDYGSYSTVTFTSGETLKLLGVHASDLQVSGHAII